MLDSTRLSAAVAAAMLVMSSSVFAAEVPATAPSTLSQQEQIDHLQAQLDALKAAQADQQSHAAQQSADATAAGVISDADRRSSDPLTLQDASGNITAGHETSRFFLRSADGNYVLHPWLQLQLRNVTNYRQEGKADGSDDWENGFEIGRFKLGFDGNVITKNLQYSVILNFGRTTGAPTLQDTFVKYQFENSPWYVRTGQYRGPLAHEGMVSSRRLITTDRSFVENVLTGNDNFIQGAEVAYDLPTKPIRFEFSVDGGLARNNQNFQNYSSNPTTGKADWGIETRLEYKIFGDWADYQDFTAYGSKHDLAVVGGGVDESEYGDSDQVTHTVDITYKNIPTGLGLFAAYYGRYTSNNQGPFTFNNLPVQTSTNIHDTYDWGVEVQGTYVFADKWEAFGRYDYLGFDSHSVSATAVKDVHEIAVGSNYYFSGQNAKATLELIYLPNGTPITDSSQDLIANNQAELLIKGQIQLLI